MAAIVILDIAIGAQSTLGGKTFSPKNIGIKINKKPEFYVIFARKYVFPRFFFFWGGRGKCPHAPVSYAYDSGHHKDGIA